MEATVFKIFLEKKKYWMGMVFKASKLFALVLPLTTKSKVVRKLKYLEGSESIVWSNRFKKQTKMVRNYFSGKKSTWQPAVDLSGYTPFAQKILKTTQEIQYGQVKSYSWLAKQAGVPKSVRAVGTVLAKNRIPLVIPCHRVIKKDGTLGRFSAGFGEKLKKILLGIEKV